MPNYNRFHVNFYLKATCNILLLDLFGLIIIIKVILQSKTLVLKISDKQLNKSDLDLVW